MSKYESIIIKFNFQSEQTVGQITKIIGLVSARYIIPIIDVMDLEANPRESSTGAVTNAIQESIEKDREVFPFKTKGILLASSQYERLERNRIRITPIERNIEGLLDGGHNTLAIGLFILKKAREYMKMKPLKSSLNWQEFAVLWKENRAIIGEYEEILRKKPEQDVLDFYVPVELLVPKDVNDNDNVEQFRNELFEICAARNNNAELRREDKEHQKGYFERLEEFLKERNPQLQKRIIWKSNTGGDIKVQNIIALAWIPLGLMRPVRDQYNRIVEPVAGMNLYNGKGQCTKQFERLMDSESVTTTDSTGCRRSIIINSEVESALIITAELPELYDYIYSVFVTHYNANGGKYGLIESAKKYDETHPKVKPFSGEAVKTAIPEGYVLPLVYGLQALMENVEVNGKREIRWQVPPMPFLQEHLGKVVGKYIGLFPLCHYDASKIGKNIQSYNQTKDAYENIMKDILLRRLQGDGEHV